MYLKHYKRAIQTSVKTKQYIFSVKLRLKEHTHKGTHIFIFLEVFNNFMNLGEFFRLDVNNESTHFLIVG